ncbi:MAG: type IV pilus secretin PilQ [Candidatus Binatia bacterium]
MIKAKGGSHRTNRARCRACVLAVHVLVTVAYAIGLFGCSASADKNAAPQITRETQASRGAPSTAEAQAVVKSPTLENQPFRIQELLVREEHGQTTLQMKFSQPVTQFRHFVLPQPARVVLDVFGDAKRLGQVESFHVDTHWVSTLRLSSAEGTLRLSADIAAATVPAYFVTPEDGGLKIVIGAVDQKATAKKDVTLVKGGKRADTKTVEAMPRGESKSQVSSTDDPRAVEKTYTGQKISLDFKDADIKNVFRLLAEVSGLNMIVTPDVNRRVTIRLIEVPWDQALNLLIDTNGLVKEQVGNVVRISTAGALKAENDALAAARRSREEREPLHTTYFNVNYAKAKDLEPRVKALMTKRPDAALVVDERSNTIMVRDIRKSIDDVSTLIAKLDRRTTQVLIESNLVETTPSFSRALGLELDKIFNDGRIIGSSRFLAGAPFAGSAQGITDQLIVPGSGFRFGYFGNNIRAILSAAENEGHIKIISRPSVVTLNNVPSTIKSERILRIALPSSTNIASGTGAAAGAAVATERIPVGINLTVIPQVSSDGFVLMNIKVKSSSIANSPTVPAGTGGVVPFDELNREAEANVLVKDGETIVIGGILKDTDATSEGGVPYLKDIPVLGWLFKNWRIQKDFEELVVFITPRIAAAGSENLPTAEELWREQMKRTQGEQAASPSAQP